jgi:biopolymer transport protein ExbD
MPSVEMIDVTPDGGAERDVTITIDENGNASLEGGDKLPLEWIGDKLQEVNAGNEAALTVVIRADELCDFRHVAEVVRQCQAAGIEKIQIAVRGP